MAELRKPKSFFKGLLVSQIFVFCVYLVYGLFCYHYQGQYTVGFAYQAINDDGYAGQSFCNVVGIITNVIAAVLYAHVGLKVFYLAVIELRFKGPHLLSRKGIVRGLARPAHARSSFGASLS